MSLLFVLALAAPKPAALFDAAIAAHTKMPRANVEVQQRIGPARSVTSVQTALPDQILMRVRESGVRGRENTDRTYYLNGRRFLAYDRAAEEWLERRNLKGTTGLQRLKAAIGSIDPAIGVVVDPEAARLWLATLRPLPWKVTATPNEWRLAYVAAKGFRTDMVLDRRRSLVKSVRWSPAGQPVTEWRFAYGSPSPIRWSVPAGAKKVDAFAANDAPPTYASPAAEAAVRRMLRAYRGYRSGIVQIATDDGPVRLAFAPGRFKQESRTSKWAYDGRFLYVKGTPRSRVSRRDLFDKVAALGGEIDPLMRELMAGVVAFSGLLSPDTRASIGGSVNLGGLQATILNLDSRRLRTSLFVRADGFVTSVSSDLLDPRGNAVTTTNRRFTYAPLGSEPFTLR